MIQHKNALDDFTSLAPMIHFYRLDNLDVWLPVSEKWYGQR